MLIDASQSAAPSADLLFILARHIRLGIDRPTGRFVSSAVRSLSGRNY
jgi:hypothetical protein